MAMNNLTATGAYVVSSTFGAKSGCMLQYGNGKAIVQATCVKFQTVNQYVSTAFGTATCNNGCAKGPYVTYTTNNSGTAKAASVVLIRATLSGSPGVTAQLVSCPAGTMLTGFGTAPVRLASGNGERARQVRPDPPTPTSGWNYTLYGLD